MATPLDSKLRSSSYVCCHVKVQLASKKILVPRPPQSGPYRNGLSGMRPIQ
jgi:hypothetical protein